LSAFKVSINQSKSDIRRLNEHIISNDCLVSTFQCPHNYIDYFSKIHAAKLIYNNVSTQNINSAQFFNKLVADQFSGFIEILRTKPSKKKSYLYFNKGTLIGGLNFNETDGTLEKELDMGQVEKKLDTALFNIYTLVAKLRNQGKERHLLINCFQEIFQMMETRSGSTVFSTLWRKCALELSNQYEFLDPLIGNFQYKDQKILLWEKINTEPAALGMNEMVNLIAKKLSIPNDDIIKIKNNYSNILVAYEIRN